MNEWMNGWMWCPSPSLLLCLCAERPYFTSSITGLPSPKSICIIVVLCVHIYTHIYSYLFFIYLYMIFIYFFIFIYCIGLYFYILLIYFWGLVGVILSHAVNQLFEYLGNDFWVHQSQKMFLCSSKWSTFYGWNVRTREQD